MSLDAVPATCLPSRTFLQVHGSQLLHPNISQESVEWIMSGRGEGPATLLTDQPKKERKEKGYIAGGHHLAAQASPIFLLDQPGKGSASQPDIALAPILMPTAPWVSHKQEATSCQKRSETASFITHLTGEALGSQGYNPSNRLLPKPNSAN